MKPNSRLFIGLGIMQLMISISALLVGSMMVMDPTGQANDLSVVLLSRSPFRDFLIPGTLLFSVIGVGHLIGGILSLRHHQQAGKASVLLGVLMIGWLSFQIYWIGFFPVQQLTFMLLGLVEIALGYRLAQRNAHHHHHQKLSL